jgi:hypothetical protein
MALNHAIFIPLYAPQTLMDIGFAGFLRDDYLIAVHARSTLASNEFALKILVDTASA